MKTPVHASDECFIPAPVTAVWEILADVAGYVAWWPRTVGLRVLQGGLLGAEVEIAPRNGRTFRCKVVAVDVPTSMTWEYSGSVTGAGVWRLAAESHGTRLRYVLATQAPGWIVRLISLFVDLSRIHSAQMRDVFEGLIRRLQDQSRNGD